jgi:hypothetical protein
LAARTQELTTTRWQDNSCHPVMLTAAVLNTGQGEDWHVPLLTPTGTQAVLWNKQEIPSLHNHSPSCAAEDKPLGLVCPPSRRTLSSTLSIHSA